MTFFTPHQNGDDLGNLRYHDHWNSDPRSIRYECNRPTTSWLQGDFPLICPRCDAEMTEATGWQCNGCSKEFTQGRADAIASIKPTCRSIPYMRGYRAGEQTRNRQCYSSPTVTITK